MLHTRSARSGNRGFTILELLVVVAIIGILVGILLPVLGLARKKARQSAAVSAMQTISMALEKYRDDFHYYPPHDQPLGSFGSPASGAQGGSECLAYYLCRKHAWGDMHYGPYMENVGEGRLIDPGTGKKRLMSPLGGMYQYMLLEDEDVATNGAKARRRCIVVDAGTDNEWGGSIDIAQGWVPDNSDNNNDSEMDDKDNIFSSTPTGN